MKLRYLLAAAAGLMASAAGAHAQCTGNVGVTTIHNCAPGVSVQPTDELFGWQLNQNPHTRRVTVGQILGALNNATQVGSPSTSDNLVMAPNGTTPQLVSINTLLGMIPPPTLSGGGTMSGTFAGNPTFSGNPVFSGAPVLSAGVVTATGSTTARTLAARALDTINVLDLPGIKADTKTSTSAATMTAGGNTLTLAGGVFTAADVGKYIVVAGAGPSSTTGQLMSVPVTSAGSYTVAPTASASGSPTTPAVIQVLTALQTPTVNANGSGLCNNGTYTASVTGGTFYRQAQVTVTVSSGNLTAISLLDGGAYTTAPSLTGASLSGLGACVATANFAGLGVYKILMMTPGAGYALSGTTVSLSGGTGTAATLGTPVVKPSQSSLASTITGFTSATQVTLADNAATAITSSTVGIWWGHDDAAAINTAGTTLCTSPGYGGRLYFPQLPSGQSYGIASPLNACTRYAELDFDGQGTLVTRIAALQYMDAMVAGATANVPANVHALTLEGAGVVRHLMNFYQGKEITVRDVMGRNVAAPGTYTNAAQGSLVWATTSQILLGNSGYIGDTLEVTIDSSNRFENEMYISPASWPNYGIEVYGTDNKFGEFSIVNVQTSGVWDLSGGNNRFHGTHVFNFFSGQDQPPVRPTYCFYSKGNVSLLNTACDGAINSGTYIAFLFGPHSNSIHTEVIGTRTWWGNLNEGGDVIGESNSYGITLEAGVQGAVVVNNAAVNAFSGANVLQYTGNPGVGSVTLANSGASAVTALGAGNGTGSAIVAIAPDGTATVGGNAPGANSINLTTCAKTAATQVASGTGSAILWGCNNIVSGQNAAAGGSFNSVTARASFVRGESASDLARQGQDCYAFGRLNNQNGSVMRCQFVLYGQQAGAGTKQLAVSGGVVFNSVVQLATNSAYTWKNISVQCFDITNHTDHGMWTFPPIFFTRASGNIAMDPSSVSATSVASSAAVSGFTVSITTDTTRQAPNVSVTTAGTDTWDCAATADLTESD